jgi:hypothetical protein
MLDGKHQIIALTHSSNSANIVYCTADSMYIPTYHLPDATKPKNNDNKNAVN